MEPAILPPQTSDLGQEEHKDVVDPEPELSDLVVLARSSGEPDPDAPPPSTISAGMNAFCSLFWHGGLLSNEILVQRNTKSWCSTSNTPPLATSCSALGLAGIIWSLRHVSAVLLSTSLLVTETRECSSRILLPTFTGLWQGMRRRKSWLLLFEEGISPSAISP